MLKLETICLQTIINLGMVMGGKIIPAPLVEKIKEIETINGNFISEDQQDTIKEITIRYNGESTQFTFKLNESLHEVTICKNGFIPIKPELQYFVIFGPHTPMYIDISLNGNGAEVVLSAEDFQWKWSLSLEIQ